MRPTQESLSLVRRAAPAKLNLYLHVLGRRDDGYHLLDSLVAFADIADIVTARPADALSLEITGPFATALQGDPSENLVWRAASALAARAGIEAKAALTLEKNLPVASGIGGGSSDAAAALKALGELWRLDLGERTFQGLAESLGADVPVCLFGETAWLGGIGERVAPAPSLPPAWVVLVNPAVSLATPAVFKARAGAFSEPARFETAPEDAATLARLLEARRNDLTPAAVALAPDVAAALRALEAETGALIARMSGSGATCFALFADADSAARAAGRLGRAHPGWWVAAGRLL
ncbi:MAG TPA: 4-(cytidine 5'-diphospho)-2-C-methyl-D-erythritol kinase [Stellaceae bacterium]|nr:4-(cytidine 5'-diphospho)-2-C-methyl-D-erythritol kinase [Stellaceae bacterium]